MKEYVIGFCFNKEKDSVVLIEKLRPAFQKGLLNGVGGKIEKNELPIDAMIREFKEETGVITNKTDWKKCIVMDAPNWKVFVFRNISEDIFVRTKTVTDEKIIKIPTSSIVDHDIIPNLSWMIPMVGDDKLLVGHISYS